MGDFWWIIKKSDRWQCMFLKCLALIDTFTISSDWNTFMVIKSELLFNVYPKAYP